MKSGIGERFKQKRTALGLSQAQVAKQANVSQQSYQEIEKGEVKQPRRIHEFAKILKTTPEYLLFGTEINLNEAIPLKNFKKIPLLDWKDICGSNKIQIPQSQEEGKTIMNFGNYKEGCFALTVQGDSMTYSRSQKNFNDGDIIVVDPKEKPAQGKYIVYTDLSDNTASFKQYVIDGNQTFLKPLNPQYPLITLNENIIIKGVVIAHIDPHV